MTARTALVVEDSSAMRQMIGFALRRRGFEVTEAADGVDALRKLQGTRYDVVFSDINMPNLDGLKLIRQLRADPIHKDVPIVVITTEAGAVDRDHALALGANAYLTKPVTAAQIESVVAEIVKN